MCVGVCACVCVCVCVTVCVCMCVRERERVCLCVVVVVVVSLLLVRVLAYCNVFYVSDYCLAVSDERFASGRVDSQNYVCAWGFIGRLGAVNSHYHYIFTPLKRYLICLQFRSWPKLLYAL